MSINILSTSVTTFASCCFNSSPSVRFEVIPCGFDLHFHDDYWWASFHTAAGHLYIFFEKCLLTSSGNLKIRFFDIEFYIFLYFDINSLSDISFTTIFSHRLTFRFTVQKHCSLMWSHLIIFVLLPLPAETNENKNIVKASVLGGEAIVGTLVAWKLRIFL